MEELLSPAEESALKNLVRQLSRARELGDTDTQNRRETEIQLLKRGRKRRLECVGKITIPPFKVKIETKSQDFDEWAKTKK